MMSSKISRRKQPALATSRKPLYFAEPPAPRSYRRSPTPVAEYHETESFRPPKLRISDTQQRSNSPSASPERAPKSVKVESEPLSAYLHAKDDTLTAQNDYNPSKPTELSSYSKNRFELGSSNPHKIAPRTSAQRKVKTEIGMGSSILHNTTKYGGVQKSSRSIRQSLSEEPTLVTTPQPNLMFNPQPVSEQEVHQAQVDFTTAMQSVANLRAKIVDTLQVYGTKIVQLEERNLLQNRRIEALEAVNKLQSRRLLQLEAEMRDHKSMVQGLAGDMDALTSANAQSEDEDAYEREGEEQNGYEYEEEGGEEDEEEDGEVDKAEHTEEGE